MEDLKSTGQELMDMCGEEDACDVKDDVDSVQSKYDRVRRVLREKLNSLDEAYRNVTSDVSPFPFKTSCGQHPRRKI